MSTGPSSVQSTAPSLNLQAGASNGAPDSTAPAHNSGFASLVASATATGDAASHPDNAASDGATAVQATSSQAVTQAAKSLSPDANVRGSKAFANEGDAGSADEATTDQTDAATIAVLASVLAQNALQSSAAAPAVKSPKEAVSDAMSASRQAPQAAPKLPVPVPAPVPAQDDSQLGASDGPKDTDAHLTDAATPGQAAASVPGAQSVARSMSHPVADQTSDPVLTAEVSAQTAPPGKKTDAKPTTPALQKTAAEEIKVSTTSSEAVDTTTRAAAALLQSRTDAVRTALNSGLVAGQSGKSANSEAAGAGTYSNGPSSDTSSQGFSLQANAQVKFADSTYSATANPTASAQSQVAVETLNALSVQIQKRVNAGNTEFRMELNPADLGRVDVKLKINSAGQLSAHMDFDDPLTAAAFSARESDLRAELSKAGLTLSDDAISFSSRQNADSAASASTTPAVQTPALPTPSSNNDAGSQASLSDQQRGQYSQGQSSNGQPQTPQAASQSLNSADALAQAADLTALLGTSNAYSSSNRLSLNLLV